MRCTAMLFGDIAMQIRIIAVGKVREGYIREGIAEYLKRMQPYAKMEIVEIDDAPDGDPKAIVKEGERILGRIDNEDTVVCLDRQGKELTSEDLAEQVKAWEMQGRRICFVIGGSNGLSPEVLKRAQLALSFSKLTFPHQLFRLMLVEQVYRAFKIARGEKYHK